MIKAKVHSQEVVSPSQGTISPEVLKALGISQEDLNNPLPQSQGQAKAKGRFTGTYYLNISSLHFSQDSKGTLVLYLETKEGVPLNQATGEPFPLTGKLKRERAYTYFYQGDYSLIGPILTVKGEQFNNKRREETIHLFTKGV